LDGSGISGKSKIITIMVKNNKIPDPEMKNPAREKINQPDF
jgi:hypothetical protein